FYINDFPGQRVWQGGPYYPTAHVGLAYDPAYGPELSDDQLTSLFYDMAPAHLVLKWISKLTTVTIPDCIRFGVQGTDYGIDQGVAVPNYAKGLWFAVQGWDKTYDTAVVNEPLGPAFSPIYAAAVGVQLKDQAACQYMYDGKGGVVGENWQFQRNTK